MQRRYPPDLAAERGLGAALRTGEPQLHRDITPETIEASARDADHARLLREVGMRSAMLVPMRGHRRTVGVLTLVTSESRRAFDESDVTFASELAWRAGMAVENAWKYGAR
jgi:GAF domain-containing protein